MVKMQNFLSFLVPEISEGPNALNSKEHLFYLKTKQKETLIVDDNG